MNNIPKMIAVAKNRIIRIYKLLLIDSSKGVGYITALKPKIPSILKILEPNTFPTAISLFFFIAATTEVANSRKEVPTTNLIKPII